MTTIRPWQQSDLPTLLQMAAVTAWEITPPDDKPYTSYATVAGNAQRSLMAVLASPGGFAYVAEEGGKPVGYLAVGIQQHEKTGEPHGYMADIYVDPAHRRGGLARELHRLSEEHCRRMGLRSITNWTHAHNPLGQKASARHGFDLWGLMLVRHLR